MKLSTRYIKTSKPDKFLLNTPDSQAEEIITSAGEFSASKQGNIIILKPEGGGLSVLAVGTKPLANGEATKVKYSTCFDVLAFLQSRATALLCLIASVILLLVCILGNMQLGVMWAAAVAATAASLIYLCGFGRGTPKKVLLKRFKKHLKQFETPID